MRDKLQTVFPNSTILFVDWNSANPWSDALGLANDVTDELARALLALSREKRENVILLGHSIGGNIVVTTAALLHRYGCKVKQVFLLGAITRMDSPWLTDAIAASKDPAVILYCPSDGMLRSLLAWTEDAPVLGFCGYTGPARDGIDYVQYECPQLSWARGNHWTRNHLIHDSYMDYLIEIMAMSPAERKKKESYPHLKSTNQVYQGNAVLTWMWITEKNVDGYLLQRSRFNPGYARILGHGDSLLFEGKYQRMKDQFDSLVNAL